MLVTRVALSLVVASLVAVFSAPPATAAPPGPALAWGHNNNGQVGDGTTGTDRLTPVAVCPVGGTAPCATGLDGATAVAANGDDTLWLLADGTVAAVGFNGSGELGDGTTTNRPAPVRVCAVGQTAPCSTFLSGVTHVAAGESASYAVLSDGSLVAWGSDTSGALGIGGGGNQSTPVRVCAVGETAPCSTFLSGVTSVAAGVDFALAALSDGSVVTWGSNTFGKLGDGTTTNRPVPVRVCAVGATDPCAAFLSGITRVGNGNFHSLALRADGSLLTWGRNSSGQLGDGTTTNRSVPGPVCGIGDCGSTLGGVAGMAGGNVHSLALLANGTVAAWGNNGSGKLGDGTTTNTATPVRVCAVGATAPCATFLTGVTDLDADSLHSVAIAGGVAHAWGDGDNGRLGDGTTTDQSVPVRVCAVDATAPCATFLTGINDIDAGDDHTAAIGTAPRADLAVDLRASAPLLSSRIDYRLTITNTGPATLTAATVTLRVPDATTAVSSATCSYNPATRTANCPIGTLDPGQASVHTVRATIGLLTVGLPLPASATRASSTPTDPNPANDTDTANCVVITGLIILC